MSAQPPLAEQQLIQLLRQLCPSGVTPPTHMSADMDLRDDLGLDSALLIELTVLVHNQLGIDLGRVAAQRRLEARTVGDVLSLLSSEAVV